MKNNKLFKFFIAGLLYLLPIVVFGYVLYKAFVWVDGIIPDDYRFIPGLGILIIVIFLILFGWFTTVSRIDNIAKEYFNKALNKVPVLKSIYSTLEDVSSALVGNKKTFDKPVLVKLSKNHDMERVGFIAKEDLEFLGIGKDKIAVALPFTFSYMSKIVIVPRENVTPIDAKSSEVMKFLLSGGITEEEMKSEISNLEKTKES
ncbi:DUF502 domain-containing protein [Flavobacteriales bacterium]|jgi:uncharacterized membrane protein|nr:DUF502 domain-containing protein [Flavobacteriales bacterium]MDA9775875.1 DUF502 domain-containing protein [Flavobacteriales bacterium]MDC0015413.1 DUF502 domain-containing protein [Flavobacteriales bacterium]MDC1370662.1 DUF502 domain-containing protein [Flavobacteriales bacterium]|tara:strand:- start:7161 stop:7769 length:609 start_codon:yes stop_codon:yes gene_type:complete